MNTSTPSTQHKVQVRNAVAGMIGNFIEWFDFIVYGSLAGVIAATFFPTDNPAVSLMATFGAFAAALLFRPLGAYIFGRIGDRKGRRVALSSSLVLMSLATAAIGVLPGVAVIGVAAPILLILLRCIQGIAIGCEWSGSAVFVLESGSRKRRGLLAGVIPGGSFFGALVGSVLVLSLNGGLNDLLMTTWVWRIPFLVAIPLGLVGLYMRLRLEDTASFKVVEETGSIQAAPVKSAMKRQRKSMVVIIVGTAAMGVAGYLINTYMVSYLTTVVKVDLSTALITNIAMNAVVIASAFLGGGLSDRIGRRPVYIGSLVLMAVFAVPAFLLFNAAGFWALLGGAVLLGVFAGSLHSMIAVLAVELFPPQTRYAGSGLSYGLGTGLIGGTTPLVATWLVAATGSPLAPGWYLAGVIVVALIITVPLLRETFKTDIDRIEEDAAPQPAATRPRTSAVVD